RIVTPPITTGDNLDGDGFLAEYLLGYPVHILDDQPWPPLRYMLRDRPLEILKPISVSTPRWQPDKRIGNESPDVYCTILRVKSSIDGCSEVPSPQDIWPIVALLMTWIRVKGRQYWILHSGSGFSALFRGSVFTRRGEKSEHQNFGSYGYNVLVHPLSRELWDSMANEVSSHLGPPVSESIFCDALLSIVAGDDHKAVLELAVASEIEVTQLLD